MRVFLWSVHDGRITGIGEVSSSCGRYSRPRVKINLMIGPQVKMNLMIKSCLIAGRLLSPDSRESRRVSIPSGSEGIWVSGAGLGQ